DSTSTTTPIVWLPPSIAGAASVTVPAKPTTRPNTDRPAMPAPSSSTVSTAVNSGIVLDSSEATPAGTRRVPITSSALDTVVMLGLATAMLTQSRRCRGGRSPRRSAKPSNTGPQIAERIAVSKIGDECSNPYLSTVKLSPISAATRATVARVNRVDTPGSLPGHSSDQHDQTGPLTSTAARSTGGPT